MKTKYVRKRRQSVILALWPQLELGLFRMAPVSWELSASQWRLHKWDVWLYDDATRRIPLPMVTKVNVVCSHTEINSKISLKFVYPVSSCFMRTADRQTDFNRTASEPEKSKDTLHSLTDRNVFRTKYCNSGTSDSMCIFCTISGICKDNATIKCIRLLLNTKKVHSRQLWWATHTTLLV
jgi:hypothetical protein